MRSSSGSQSSTVSQLNIRTSQGNMLIPRSGNLTMNGREQKILVTDYPFGASNTKVLYTTSE